MRHYKLTFTGRGGTESFTVTGLPNAMLSATAFLLVTNGCYPARSSFEALDPGAATSFGLPEHGTVRIERLD